MLDILLILLLVAALGGFGWNAGWWHGPYGPAPTPGYFNPLGLVLTIVLILLLLSLLSPWPFRHVYW